MLLRFGDSDERVQRLSLFVALVLPSIALVGCSLTNGISGIGQIKERDVTISNPVPDPPKTQSPSSQQIIIDYYSYFCQDGVLVAYGMIRGPEEVPIPGGQFLGSLPNEESGDCNMYIIRNLAAGTSVDVRLRGPTDADFDLYVFERWPDPGENYRENYDGRSFSTTSDEHISYFIQQDGFLIILVDRWSGSGEYSLSVSTTIDGICRGPVPLSLNVPESDNLNYTGDCVYYSVFVPYSTSIQVSLEGPSWSNVDFDLYASRSMPLTTETAEYKSISYTSNESLTTSVLPEGTVLYIMVYSYSGAGRFYLTITPAERDCRGPINVTIGAIVHDFLNFTNDCIYYYVDLGGYYGAGRITRVQLIGPSDADFDLYLSWDSLPTRDNWVMKRVSVTSREKITSQFRPTFYLRVDSYSGSGPFTLCVVPYGEGISMPEVCR